MRMVAVYSKMFIGGLNWDTTDGTYVVRYTIDLPCSTKWRHCTQNPSGLTSRSLGKSTRARLCVMPRVGQGVLPF
jgi:hypothetical protein